MGINQVSGEDIREPKILSGRNAIVRVTASSVCRSDLHLIDGYVPGMREGGILGHEFMGKGRRDRVRRRQGPARRRVVLASFIGRGGPGYAPATTSRRA